MTLVLSVHGKDSLWVVADRRLSFSGARKPIEDAIKVMSLETVDGTGVLAYAGLGATAVGTQPCHWMSAVLRGRSGLKFEEALGCLSAAANAQLPRHLIHVPGRSHNILIPAFIDGVGSRVYSIDNAIDGKTGQAMYRYTSHQRTSEPTSDSVRLALAGTGGHYLNSLRTGWDRKLRRIVAAHDRGQLRTQAVTYELAALNYLAHQKTPGGTVGPRCVIVWRGRRDSRRPLGGGHEFYTALDREKDSPAIPAIGNGMDIQALVGVLMGEMMTHVSVHGLGVPPSSINLK